jgi:foldase protein PrsA
MSKQRKIPTPAWEHDSGLTGGLSGDRLKGLAAIAIGALALLAIAVVGFAYLQDWYQDQQLPDSTAIKVDDRKYTVSDYTERAKMFVEEIGGTNQATIILPTLSDQIIEEAILLKFASEKSVEATDEELKAEIATRLGIDATDPNFDTRLQEELATVDLTEEQYRDMARARVLKKKATDKFKEELPAASESIHYRVIQVNDQARADELKLQIDNGGDFATLAAANSLDTATKDSGGDKGWAPRGYLQETEENILFDLELNETTIYQAPNSDTIYIYQVVEKQAERPIDDDKKDKLAADALAKWITDKKDAASIDNELDFAEGNADKIRYVIDHAELQTGF